jgi:hypothetical protein
MRFPRSAFAAIVLTSGLAQAQAPGREPPPPINVAAVLNIDTARAQVAQEILDTAQQRAMAARQEIGRPVDDTTRQVLRAAMDAIRLDTNKQLAAVLTPDELAKLNAAMPPPGGPGGMAHARRTPM